MSETPQPVRVFQIAEACNPLLPKRFYLSTQIIGVTSRMTLILILILMFTGVRTLKAWAFCCTQSHFISVTTLRSVHLLLQIQAH
jgi:hypothetical protein